MAQDVQGSVNSSQGDEGYNPLFDLNGDGTISMDEGVQVLSRSEAAGNGVMIFTPEGPQTLAARSLGLEEKKVAETIRQFSATFAQTKSQMLTNFTGVLVDEDGNLIGVEDPETGIVGPVTTMAQKAFDENVRQFNEELRGLMERTAAQLGLDKDKLSLEQQKAIANMVTTGVTGITAAIQDKDIRAAASKGLNWLLGTGSNATIDPNAAGVKHLRSLGYTDQQIMETIKAPSFADILQKIPGVGSIPGFAAISKFAGPAGLALSGLSLVSKIPGLGFLDPGSAAGKALKTGKKILKKLKFW